MLFKCVYRYIFPRCSSYKNPSPHVWLPASHPSDFSFCSVNMNPVPIPICPCTSALALAVPEQRETNWGYAPGSQLSAFPQANRVSVWQVTFCWHWARHPEMVRGREGMTGWEPSIFNACLILISIQGSSLGHRTCSSLWVGRVHSPISTNITSRTSGRGRRLKGLEFLVQFLKKGREWKTYKTQRHSLPLVHSHGNASLMITDGEVMALWAGATVDLQLLCSNPTCQQGSPTEPPVPMAKL